MEIKKCTKCGEEKEYSEFNKRKASKDGLCPICCECKKIDRLIYHGKNKKEINIRQNKYREENKEQINLKLRRKYKEDPIYKKNIGSHHKKYILGNKDKMRGYREKYRSNNKEKILIRDKEYRKENKFTPTHIILCSVKSRIWNKLKQSTELSTVDLLGCTLDQAAQHVEQQFTKGMSWLNHSRSGWHIDHIKPCASFDLTDINQQRECFHYTNLQPLWAADNLRKGSKLLK